MNAHDVARDAREEHLEALLAERSHRVVEVHLIPRQRDEMLDLVLEHLADVLLGRGGQENAIARRLRPRQAEVGAPGVDSVLAREGEHGLRERLAALARPGRRRQREGARVSQRDREEALHDVREGHLVRPHVDADAVQEVGAAEALGELADRHPFPPGASGRPGSFPSHGARSNHSRMVTSSPPRSTRAAILD